MNGPCAGAPARSGPWGRRAVLGALLAAGASPAIARAGDPFAVIEAGFAARLDGPDALAAALGQGRVRPGADTGPAYRQFRAEGLPGLPFAALEMRLSRAGADGIAVLTVRPGLAIAIEAVRARYGPAEFRDVRPELPTFHLHYARHGGGLSFGFPRGADPLREAVLTWGRWA